MSDQTSGGMPADLQIKCAVEEGMENIVRAIFGENLPVKIKYVVSNLTVNGLGMVHARATAVDLSGDTLMIKADVPISWPDDEVYIYRITDAPFAVEANDWAASFSFEAWCECNPSNGAKVIIRQQGHDMYECWLVADSMDGEVLYRGPFESLFPWAKEVVTEKWSHLPHVCLDTETAAMVPFMSRRAPPPVKN